MRCGDIVRTPADGLPAIITRIEGQSATVQTATADLVYKASQLTPLARIEIGERAYTTTSGNRFQVVFVRIADTSQPQELHIKVGKRGGSYETRAFELRLLAFRHMLADGGGKETKMQAGDKVHWTQVSQRGRVLSMQRREGTIETIEGDLAQVRTSGRRRVTIAVARLRADQQPGQIDELIGAMRDAHRL
jgi:hypothetical protein